MCLMFLMTAELDKHRQFPIPSGAAVKLHTKEYSSRIPLKNRENY